MRRHELIVRGTVQGVGFRPFVFRLARELELAGAVCNHGGAVLIDVQGDAAALDAFAARLRAEARSPAQVDEITCAARAVDPTLGPFSIAPSGGDDAGGSALAPDAAVCGDCLTELRDAADRRHGYALISCSRCGPRFTITRKMPYDRPQTTMATFAMCDACAAEYADLQDRRFHAQPIACPRCGPRVALLRAGEPPGSIRGDDERAVLAAARDALAAGEVLAIKGIGGFHLAVDARQDAAVARLRRRKRRQRKPLAVMLRDLQVAHRTVELGDEEAARLRSAEAPILLAPARPGHGLCESLAPGLGDLGVMLPYSGLHHLLFDDRLDALVMTSGNAPAEPLISDEGTALRTLPADRFLVHDRPIHVACDDSVVRTTANGPLLLRRARGHVPRGLDATALPRRRVLALGAELKSTVTLLRGGELVVSRHLGDLDNPAAEAAFAAEVTRLLAFYSFDPEAVAVDLHPDLYATRLAEQVFGTLPIHRVQHHHAHLGAVLAEHGVAPEREVVGVVLDGLGLGTDGTLWGGEVLRGGYRRAARAAHLRCVPLPGGDRAAREPPRMAVSLLHDAGLAQRIPELLPGYVQGPRLATLCGTRAVAPLSSSAGRLFDGVSALLGVAPAQQEYEGEAAALLEAAADPRCADGYPLPLRGDELDTRALVLALVADDAPTAIRAARFHNGLADGLARAAARTGLDTVALGGGSMVNRLLLARLVARLESQGQRVLLPRRLPPGDGGLSAGQAACAACLL